MNRNTFILLFLLLTACSQVQKQQTLYVNSQDTLVVKSPVLVNVPENGIFEFEKLNPNAAYKETGMFEEGFRVGDWHYEIGNFNQKLHWGILNDTTLGLRFNLFQGVDSINTGKGYGRIMYPAILGNIGATYFLNGQLKKMIPALGYEQAVKAQFDTLNFQVLNYEMRKLPTRNNDVAVVKVKLQSNRTGKTYYSNYIYAFIKQEFLELSVDFDDPGNVYANILFNGILTNLTYKGQRLYSPYLKPESK